MLTKEEIIEILKTVQDPEINMDVWTLGLIYKLEVSDDKVSIDMTLTSPMCPFGQQIMDEVKEKITAKGVAVNLQLTFEPPWEPSEELRGMLGV